MARTIDRRTTPPSRIMAAILAGGLFCASWAGAVGTLYVAPNGDDTSPGTKAQPLKTVQKAVERASDGDTISLKKGTYDLSGLTETIDKALTLIGEDKHSTILTDSRPFGQMLTFSNSLALKNLKFSGGPVLKPSPPEGQKLEGIVIDNCVFEKFWAGIHARDYGGVITNVSISKCEFLDMEGGKVVAIAIFRGLVSNVKITDNSFRNLRSTQKGCNAIILGDLQTTRDVLISGNHMDTIIGPTRIVDGAGAEVHGILIYGTQVRILKNTVKNLNAGRDHEAIYMKARSSIIADNVVENCGSEFGGADICSKGGEFSEDNVITGNRITGDQPGCGIFASGGTLIKSNYVKKTSGSLGINVYPLGKPVTITDNYVETKHPVAIYLNGGDGAGYPFEWPNPGEVVISKNVAVSYDRREGRTPVYVSNAPWAKITDNEERQGRQ